MNLPSTEAPKLSNAGHADARVVQAADIRGQLVGLAVTCVPSFKDTTNSGSIHAFDGIKLTAMRPRP